MPKISGATHKPRVTGHTEIVKKPGSQNIKSQWESLPNAFLANMAATEAIVGLIGRKLLKG